MVTATSSENANLFIAYQLPVPTTNCSTNNYTMKEAKRELHSFVHPTPQPHNTPTPAPSLPFPSLPFVRSRLSAGGHDVDRHTDKLAHHSSVLVTVYCLDFFRTNHITSYHIISNHINRLLELRLAFPHSRYTPISMIDWLVSWLVG